MLLVLCVKTRGEGHELTPLGRDGMENPGAVGSILGFLGGFEASFLQVRMALLPPALPMSRCGWGADE